jgi:DNA polymerase I-like protein with 3'-5' exonuclease and polymerase domains
MLQNGESVIMKHSALQWVRQAKQQNLDFKLVTWPHDEWQTEIRGGMAEAEQLGSLQRQSIVDTGIKFDMICPLAGSTDIGKNWKDTH